MRRREKLRFYCRFLLEQNGGDVDTTFETTAKGTSLLHAAALRHDYELASFFTSMGADALAVDELGRMPIFYAASAVGNFAVEEFRKWLNDPPLKEHLAALPFSHVGADTSDQCGTKVARMSDLLKHYAPFDTKVIEVMLEGCKLHPGKLDFVLNRVDAHGNSALHAAAWSENRAAGMVLLQAGIERNAKTTYFRQTPLHIAVSRKQLEFVRILLEGKSSEGLETDVNAVDKWGRTALDYARATANSRLEDFFVERGGRRSGEEFEVSWGGKKEEGCDIAWVDAGGLNGTSTETYSDV